MKIVEVSAGIVRNGDMILLAQRPPESRHAGRWEFPGGKLEQGETPEECLHRELCEELQLEIHSPQVVFQHEHRLDDEVQLRLFFIECELVTGSTPCPVHGQQVIWSKPLGLLDYELLKPDRAAVEFLVKREESGRK